MTYAVEYDTDLLDDVGVQHGKSLCYEGQAAHTCKHLQGGLDRAGLQEGVIYRSIQTVVPWGHWFVVRTAA